MNRAKCFLVEVQRYPYTLMMQPLANFKNCWTPQNARKMPTKVCHQNRDGESIVHIFVRLIWKINRLYFLKWSKKDRIENIVEIIVSYMQLRQCVLRNKRKKKRGKEPIIWKRIIRVKFLAKIWIQMSFITWFQNLWEKCQKSR